MQGGSAAPCNGVRLGTKSSGGDEVGTAANHLGGTCLRIAAASLQRRRRRIDAGTLTLTGSRRRRGQRVKWWPAATLIERLPPRAARGECRELSRAGTDPCLDPTHGLIATAGDALKLAPLPAKHVFPLSVRLRLSVGHASAIEMQIRARVRVRPPVGRGGEHGGRVVRVSLAWRES